MNEVATRLHFDSDGSMTVETVQDVEDILEHNKTLRSMPQRSDWGRHKWSAPNVIVEKLFNEFNKDCVPPRPMSTEFWVFVDKKMDDPDYKAFRVDDPANPFFIGYRK